MELFSNFGKLVFSGSSFHDFHSSDNELARRVLKSVIQNAYNWSLNGSFVSI